MRKQISILIIVMFLSIPFYVSTSLAEVNTISGDGGTEFDINQSMKDSILSNDSLSGCADEIEDTEKWVEILEKDEIRIMEGVSVLATTVCTVMGSIHYMLDSVGILIGYLEGGCCPMALVAGAGTGPCANNDILSNWMDPLWHNGLTNFCAFVNQGVCSPGVLGDWASFNEYGINQFEVFPAALLCFNVPAILYNLRKYVTLQKIYGCCLTQACGNGLSQEPCEQWLDEAECMYIKGGIITGLYQYIIGLALSFITFKKIKDTGAAFFLNCVQAPLDLYGIKAQWESINQQIEYVDAFFDEPKCEDLGFGEMSDYEYAPYQPNLPSKTVKNYFVMSDSDPTLPVQINPEDVHTFRTAGKNMMTEEISQDENTNPFSGEDWSETYDGGLFEGGTTVSKKQMKNMVSQWTNIIIGYVVDDYIEDSCKEEWNSSSISPPPPPPPTPNELNPDCEGLLNQPAGYCDVVSSVPDSYGMYTTKLDYKVLNCFDDNRTFTFKLDGKVKLENVDSYEDKTLTPSELSIRVSSGKNVTGTAQYSSDMKVIECSIKS